MRPEGRGQERPGTLTLVVNPASGGGAGRSLAPRAGARLAAVTGAAVRTVISDSWDDAARAMTAAVDEAVTHAGNGPHSLVVVGGDGMTHLGLNAVAGTPVRLGVVPMGTGNDFCRGTGLPRRPDLAIAGIASGRVRTIDLARVSHLAKVKGDPTRMDGEQWVGSVVSTGYDARVNRGVNALSRRLGALSYGYVALRELAGFSPLHYRIRIDGGYRELDAMLVAVGNAGWIGGGMQICPGADVADGMLDVTIVEPCSRATLVRALGTLYTGGFVRLPFVQTLRARRVEVDGDGLFAMADGEEIGAVPLSIECRPGSLHLLG